MEHYTTTEIKSNCRSFLSIFEDEVYHVIQLSPRDDNKNYLIVFDDAYEQRTGNTQLVTKDELETLFNIYLD